MVDNKCRVPDCKQEIEFVSPNKLCEKHWNIWFNWPIEDDDKEPAWFTRVGG